MSGYIVLIIDKVRWSFRSILCWHIIQLNVFCVSDCDDGQFTCSNGLCRPQYFVCDRVNDCGDNSDEEHCGEFLLLCFNECIYSYQHLPFRKLIQMKPNTFKEYTKYWQTKQWQLFYLHKTGLQWGPMTICFLGYLRWT